MISMKSLLSSFVMLLLAVNLANGANQSVLKHGNYCGPGYTGGQKSTKSDNACKADWKPPVDQTDAACQKHDYAYARAGVTANTPQSNPDKKAADLQLIRNLQAAKLATKKEEAYNQAAQAVFATKVLMQAAADRSVAKKQKAPK
jgi:hypothetical protein